MRVIFETIGGTKIPVEVDNSGGTLKEMKRQAKKALKIPMSRQILSFNGNILRRDADLLALMHGSVIGFRVADGPDASPFPTSPCIDLRLDVSPDQHIVVKTCGGDTFRELKKRIQRKEGTPADRILFTTREGVELPDGARLLDYPDLLNVGWNVQFISCNSSATPSHDRPPPLPAPTAGDAELMWLALQFRGEMLPEAVKVRSSSMVRELRYWLEARKFEFPVNGVVFFHGDDLLDEFRSFAFQKVVHGDIIRIYSPGDRKRLECVS